MKKRHLSYALFVLSSYILAGTISAKSSIAYRHIVVGDEKSEGEDSKAICEARRKSFGEIFQTAYRLDAVLTSCENYVDEGLWAIIFAFDASVTTMEIPVILKGETWKGTLTYHVTTFIQETRHNSYVLWNGVGWEARTHEFTREVPVTQSLTSEFGTEEECDKVLAVYLRESRRFESEKVVGAKCMQTLNQWSLNILKTE